MSKSVDVGTANTTLARRRARLNGLVQEFFSWKWAAAYAATIGPIFVVSMLHALVVSPEIHALVGPEQTVHMLNAVRPTLEVMHLMFTAFLMVAVNASFLVGAGVYQRSESE